MSTKTDVHGAVDTVIEAREELIRRGIASGDALIMTGLALGVLLSGGNG